MKLNGFVGKGSGRLGSSVFAVRGGEQIVRQYTPNVANPNTDGQRAQRAKFKLLSQVAAIAARGLLFPKVGNVSRRNAFMAANMSAVSFAVDVASLNLNNMTLGVGYEPITVVREDMSGDGVVVVSIDGEGWDGLAFATFDYISAGRVVGISGTFKERSGAIPVIPNRMARTTVVVAAWRYSDNAARVKYGSIISREQSASPETVAVRLAELVSSGAVVVSDTVIAKPPTTPNRNVNKR